MTRHHLALVTALIALGCSRDEEPAAPSEDASPADGGDDSVVDSTGDSAPAGPLDRTAAGLIPIERTTDWTKAGVPGGIVDRKACIVDVTKAPYNADATGATNAGPAIQEAINAAAEDCVVFLPAGTFRIDGALIVGFVGGNKDKDKITIRGAGMDKTTIDCRANRCIEVGSESDYLWNWPPMGNEITAGLTRDSGTLTIADAKEFAVGDIVQITFDNDPELPVISVNPFPGLRRQKARVTAKTDTTLTVTPPIHGDFSKLKARVNRAQYQSDFVGIEDLTIDGSNGTVTFGIMFSQAYASWVKDVRVRHASNYSMYATDSLNCEVRHSYFDELTGSGPNHSGFLMGGSGAFLFEDNIIVKSFPGIEVNSGSTANVFAYNFIEGPDVGGMMGCAIDTNHGAHNAFNLYEGNVAQMLQSDGYFGSDSDETIYRNWFHATNKTTDQNGKALYINRFSRRFNVVGNILGSTAHPFVYDNEKGSADYGKRYAYTLGLPNIGNGGFNGKFAPPWPDFGMNVGPGGYQELDTEVEKTMIRKGNWNAADKAIRASEAITVTLPASLYRETKPSWFRSLAWPPFDAKAPAEKPDAIPAGYRFTHGKEAP
jgi:hypothetical protein